MLGYEVKVGLARREPGVKVARRLKHLMTRTIEAAGLVSARDAQRRLASRSRPTFVAKLGLATNGGVAFRERKTRRH